MGAIQRQEVKNCRKVYIGQKNQFTGGEGLEDDQFTVVFEYCFFKGGGAQEIQEVCHQEEYDTGQAIHTFQKDVQEVWTWF